MLHGDTYAGFQATGCGQYQDRYQGNGSMPNFSAAGTKRFVQICNVSDHWVCVTNVFSRESHDVYVYDSLYETISDKLLVQVSSLLRGEETPDQITFHVREFQKQSHGRKCGFFAAASAVAIVNGVDPSFLKFNERQLQSDFCMLHNDGLDKPFQSSIRIVQNPDKAIVVLDKVHCVCHRKSIGKMVQCGKCLNWYHNDCVVIDLSQSTLEENEWIGPCCFVEVPRDQDIVYCDSD